ncbi:MAG: BatA and WFA domain-containing protein, partial [Lachnospiraceae bacterium]|nr:BatA and WFA domain-containing protein [Lachnospiraceae bacterium]
MSVINLWPLFLILLVPVIILLYILKQKGTDEEVGSTMLWRETIRNTEATTPWEKYKHNILMYLQIATVLLLAFALMAPFLKQGGRDFSQVILVLDNSASMNSIYDGERTRFEEAKARARDYIDSLNENCAITIISAVGGGEILASNLVNKQAAKAVLADMRCTELAGTLEDCKHMVQSVSAQWKQYGITMFTDAPVVLDNMEATVVNLSTEGENMAVNYVSYGVNDDGTLTVLAKISNFGAVDGSREINLYGDDTLLDIQNVTVPAGDSAVIYFEGISFNGALLEAEINEKDMLPNDNTAGVVVNSNGMKRVLLVTGGNTFIEKALSAVSGLDLYKTTDLSVIGKNESFDLYIFDNVMPESLPDSGNVVFLNPESSDAVTVEEEQEGVKLSFAPSDLSAYLEESSFGVNHARVLARPAWATTFLTSGTDCCGYYGEDGVRKMVAMGFDIHET